MAAQVGSQWIDMYQALANANEREVAAFSKGYSADHERAYAALQHWTICDGDANLVKLINALHHHRRIDVVEKIRGIMEDNPQVSCAKPYITKVLRLNHNRDYWVMCVLLKHNLILSKAYSSLLTDEDAIIK